MWAVEHKPSNVAHGSGHFTACGVISDQGWNLCLLHWQADSLPLSHQGNLFPELSICAFWDSVIHALENGDGCFVNFSEQRKKNTIDYCL